MKHSWMARVAVAMALGTTVACSFAKGPQAGVQTPEAEVRQFFAGQQAANQRGASPPELAHRFYADNVTIIGEGEATPKRGMSDAIKALADWGDYLGPDGNKGCNFTLQEPVIATTHAASAFAVLHCEANPPKLEKAETIRQLFVLKKTSKGWRVVQEMWQSGGFGQ
ncbi:hypothetical protein GCM10027082_05810 [Comamonas humi]